MLRRLGVAVLAGGAALAAAELVLRALGLAPAPGLFTVTAAEYARVPGIFAPGQQLIEAAGTRFEHETRIDSLGYRGRGFPRAKPPGELRVLHVGDSFTWGHNVADDSTMPAHLERVLRAWCGAARVVNAGLSGSSIAGQDAMALRGLAVDPDVVLLMSHENDIDELAYERRWEQLAENRAAKSRFPLSLLYPALRSSAIWNLALTVRAARQPYAPQRAGLPDGAAPADRLAPEVIEARAAYARRLSALADRLGARGVPLVVALYPHPESVRRGHATSNQVAVRAAAESLGLPTIDILDSLRATDVPLEAAFLLPEDYHPSPTGHALGAAYVAPRLLAAIRRPGCRGP